jgi:hypothetical protein
MYIARSTNGKKTNPYILLVGKPKGKKTRHRWLDNIKMDLGEMGLDDVDLIGLAQDRDSSGRVW